MERKAIHAVTRKLHNEAISGTSVYVSEKNRFMTDKSLQYSKTDFFELQPQESAKQERLLDIERKSISSHIQSKN